MLYIAHRINTVEQLSSVAFQHGIEVDLRDHGQRIVMQHDPFIASDVQDFERLLQAYNHALIILNVKSERIEFRVLEYLEKYGVKNYFFLDSSFPMMCNLAARGVREMAIRFSEYEPIEYAMAMAGQCDWVWVDCFNKLPLTPAIYDTLRKHFKICIVSPELQGRSADSIAAFAKELTPYPVDAICTKRPDLWQQAGFESSQSTALNSI